MPCGAILLEKAARSPIPVYRRKNPVTSVKKKIYEITIS